MYRRVVVNNDSQPLSSKRLPTRPTYKEGKNKGEKSYWCNSRVKMALQQPHYISLAQPKGIYLNDAAQTAR